MSLSNISKNHLGELLKLSNNVNHNVLENIKKDHVSYTKLQFIHKQIEFLKKEALEIINNSETQNYLHIVKCGCKKVSGNYYYLYENNSEHFLSLIAPNEWNHNYIFKGKYYYDFDKQFIKI